MAKRLALGADGGRPGVADHLPAQGPQQGDRFGGQRGAAVLLEQSMEFPPMLLGDPREVHDWGQRPAFPEQAKQGWGPGRIFVCLRMKTGSTAFGSTLAKVTSR